VNETKNVFHCFGCGESGNAISFLMKINHIDFRQAATRILQLAGLEYYDIDDWLQSETSIIYNSIEKTVKENIDNDSIDIYLEDINKTLVYIAYTINSKVREYPELFDKMEKIYLMVDDNYRFKNYERIRDICKKLSKIIKEFSNGS
jgi:DNA primase